ncbi:MAG: MerR family transcriptional regulator [Lachnospiraceae bacterium]|nr:MerR family transcriptional regulator [Lachnospiraceae bacterium]
MSFNYKHYFKIGDLSKLFLIGVDSIRYYEKVGLLHPIRNPENNYRLYTIDDLRTMNTIRELLDLGLGTDQILQFEKDRNLSHVMEMLDQATDAIDRQIKTLQDRRDNISSRIRSINQALAMDIDGKVHIRTLPARHGIKIAEGEMPAEMISYMIAKYSSTNFSKTSTIGACDCYTLDTDHPEDGDYPGKNVFLYSPSLNTNNNFTLPAGDYAYILFRGPYNLTQKNVEGLFHYIKEHHLKKEGDVLEFCHIDRFETSDYNEYVTELQVLVSKE